MSDNTDLEQTSQLVETFLTGKKRDPKHKKAKSDEKIGDEHAKDETVAAFNDDRKHPITYDVEEVERFICTVFHAVPHTETNEYVICYKGGMTASPVAEAQYYKLLERTQKPDQLHVSTITVHPDARGRLYNRQEHFERYHVLVLDDVGTKVAIDDITLPPSYIVETSKDNFQYGYVFKTPIEDMQQAKALLSLVYTSGFSDQGGKLINKKVRIPQGIHGKKSSSDIMFRTKLVELTAIQYTPQELLDGFDIGTTWEAIEKDAQAVLAKNKKRRAVNYSNVTTALETIDGTIDPILEFLHEQGHVFEDGDDWVKIQCPWHTRHTNAEEKYAYYSPIGRGGEHACVRGFRCFHESCQEESIKTFLAKMALQSGLDMPVFDPLGNMLNDFCYDAQNDMVFNLRGEYPEIIKGFDKAYNKYYAVPSFKNATREEKWKHLTTAQLFHNHPNRLIFEGTTFDPRSDEPFVLQGDLLRLNLFKRPDYGDGPIDMSLVEPFRNHLKHLIPNKDDLKVIEDMIAEKLKNPAFRGWGVLMIADERGTGRNTFANMLAELFHPRNYREVNVETLIGSSEFNEWQGALIVVTGEVERIMAEGNNRFKAFEALKDRIDTTSRIVTINTKYGTKHQQLACSTNFLFSNSKIVNLIEEKDRRIYVLYNTNVLKPLEYFVWMNKHYIGDKDKNGIAKFVPHVARYYLTQHEYDGDYLYGNVPMTEAKEHLLEATRTPAQIIVNTFLKEITKQTNGLFPAGLFEDVVGLNSSMPTKISACFGFEKGQKGYLKNLMMQATRSTNFKNGSRFRVKCYDGRRRYLRIFREGGLNSNDEILLKGSKNTTEQRLAQRKAEEAALTLDPEQLRQTIEDALDAEGMIS